MDEHSFFLFLLGFDVGKVAEVILGISILRGYVERGIEFRG